MTPEHHSANDEGGF
jgi:hypothetical protein